MLIIVTKIKCLIDFGLLTEAGRGIHATVLSIQTNALHIFSAFDHNNDGSISKEELREAMTRYGQMFSAAECDEMFREADANGDGSIDFDEFLKMMMEDQVCNK